MYLLTRKKIIAAFAACITFFVISCGGGGGGGGGEVSTSTPTNISGAAQKGPFLQGSTTLVNLLDNNGDASDLTIVTQTDDSLGNFNFTTHHKGPVQIVTTGYYFNEVSGVLSDGPLTLRGIYNVSSNGDQVAYVNILTHLINNRVLKLISENKHLSIDEALSQAQDELLSVMTPLANIQQISDFGKLSLYDIEGTDSANNSYLLAISAAFCQAAIDIAIKNSSSVTAELTLLLNVFSDDLAQDGAVDSILVLEQLQPALMKLDSVSISQNLASYSNTVLSVTLPTPDISDFLDSDQQNSGGGGAFDPDLTIGDPDDVEGFPDMTALSINTYTDTIEFFLKFADPNYLDNNSVYIYLYGTNRDMFRVYTDDFTLARDPGADGHFEQVVATGTVDWLASDELRIIINRSDMLDIDNKDVWAYSMASGDRVPDYGAIATASFFTPRTDVRFTLQGDQTLTAGEFPFSIIIEDLNNDKHREIIVANRKSDFISIFFNNGDGSYGPAVNYTTGLGNQDVAVGDLDGDGHMDLAVTYTTAELIVTDPGYVAVLYGNGDGTFGSANHYVVGVTPNSVRIGDLDGNDSPDLVVSNSNSGNVSVLLNSGGTSFSAAVNYSTGVGNPRDMTLSDLNGDSAPDIAMAANMAAVMLNDGNGAFSSPASGYATPAAPYAVSVGDFNDDRSGDVVVADPTVDMVSVFLGNGDGTLPATVDYATGLNPFDVATGDLNNDTIIDIVTTNRDDSTFSVLAGVGDGSFLPAVDFDTEYRTPRCVAIGDLNNDGKSDLVIGSYTSSNISIFLNTLAD